MACHEPILPAAPARDMDVEAPLQAANEDAVVLSAGFSRGAKGGGKGNGSNAPSYMRPTTASFGPHQAAKGSAVSVK